MITILTVDDDTHIRELLKLYLQKEGYRVVEAADGEEAIEILEKEQVNLAIVDIMMPHMDGYELCEELRDFYDMLVIMFTAKNELTVTEKAYVAVTEVYVL